MAQQYSNKAAISHLHDDRYYTETETNNLINAILPRIIYYSGVVDASAGNKTVNMYLNDTGTFLLIANKGASDNESSVYILTSRNGAIYKTALKTTVGITIDTYQLLLGVNYTKPYIGILTVTKLSY